MLEVGSGTGLNLPWYDSSQVQILLSVDESSEMLSLAKLRADELGILDWVRFQQVEKSRSITGPEVLIYS